jgi:hypothetical protein
MTNLYETLRQRARLFGYSFGWTYSLECGAVLGKMGWRTVAKTLLVAGLLILLVLSPGLGMEAIAARGKERSGRTEQAKPTKLVGKLTETSPPQTIQELGKELEKYQPQVAILSPRQNEVLQDDTVSVRFEVKDLPIFKEENLGLGPHLHVFLDNQPYQPVYDLSQPLVLENLAPGTHSLRVFASRPWQESFKNDGAYAQAIFHVFAKTGDNQPEPGLPLLTYSRPQGSYGAEPILLDFYLTNAPLHLVATEDTKDDIPDWRIRCTVNGESFILDRWQPVYLKGFKPGRNWVQLEYIDEKGNPIKNVFNNTVRLVTYEPGGKDTLSKLVRGDLSPQEAGRIVDLNYQPSAEAPIAPEAPASPEPLPSPIAPPSPAPEPEPVIPEPAPSVVVPPVVVSPVVPESEPSETAPEAEEEAEEPVKPEPPAETAQPSKPPFGFLNRFRPAPSPAPSSSPAAPTPLETPQPAELVPAPAASSELEPSPAAVSPPEVTPGVEVAPQPTESKPAQPPAFRKFFDSSVGSLRDRFRQLTPKPVEPATSPAPDTSPAPVEPAAPIPSSTEPEPPAETEPAALPSPEPVKPSPNRFYERFQRRSRLPESKPESKPENTPPLSVPEPAASPEVPPSVELTPEVSEPVLNPETSVPPVPDSPRFSAPPRLITPEPEAPLPTRFQRLIPEPIAPAPDVPPTVTEPILPEVSGSTQ